MHRRTFLKTGVGAASVAAAMSTAVVRGDKKAQTTADGLRTKIAVSPQWFEGSHVQQIEQIAAAGFSAFETLGCGGWEDKEAVRKRCEELGVLCGAVGGGMGTITEWGPNDPENHPRFVEAVKAAIANAKAIGSKRVLSLSGPARENVSKEEQMEALVQAGKLVAPLLEEAGIVMVWETLNVLVDHAGYFLVYSADGAELVQRTGHPNVKFLFDIYHQQISEGNLINNIKKYINEIGHFHFADNPGRHEPGTGEINFPFLFEWLDRIGYRGWVGCEYVPAARTEDGLHWMKPHVEAAPPPIEAGHPEGGSEQ